MGYKVQMRDGSVITLANATKQMKDGSGLYLYDENDVQVASFIDGTFNACYPSDASVEEPLAPIEPE